MSAEARQTERPRHAAPAVIAWCVLAAALVATLLLVEPENRFGVPFWNASGAFDLLADLLIVFLMFVLPALLGGAWRAHMGAAAVVLLTGTAGLVMLNVMAAHAPGAVVQLVAFTVLAAAGAAAWSHGSHRAAWFAAASLLAFGVPFVIFFADELLALDLAWLGAFSPMTAWRAMVEGASPAWLGWVVFGFVLLAGAVTYARRMRRARP